MQLYLRLAWRNIWRHRRRTIIIVLAMSMTLALMMWYDGLMNGFTDAIYGNAVKVLGGNIQVHAVGYRARRIQPHSSHWPIRKPSSMPRKPIPRYWVPLSVSTLAAWSPTMKVPLRSV